MCPVKCGLGWLASTHHIKHTQIIEIDWISRCSHCNSTIKKVWRPSCTFFKMVFNNLMSTLFETYWPLYSCSVWLNNHFHPLTAIVLLSTAQGQMVIKTNLPVRTTPNDELTLFILYLHHCCVLHLFMFSIPIHVNVTECHSLLFINCCISLEGTVKWRWQQGKRKIFALVLTGKVWVKMCERCIFTHTEKHD